MNRKELFDYAVGLKQKTAGVELALAALTAAAQDVAVADQQMEIFESLRRMARKTGTYAEVGGAVGYALAYERTHAVMRFAFGNLAIVLQEQGHEIEY